MRTRLQYQGGYGGATATRISWHHAIIFDTFRGRIITKEKFDKLMTLLWEIMQLVTCSPQGMAKLRGKAQHQKQCIEEVRPFLVTWCALTCLSAGRESCTSGTSSSRSRRSCDMRLASCISTYLLGEKRELRCGLCSPAHSTIGGCAASSFRTVTATW